MVFRFGGAILRSHGDAKHAMSATLWGAVANAVFDVLLILVLHLVMTGAARFLRIPQLSVISGSIFNSDHQKYLVGGFDPPTVAGLKADLAPVYAIASARDPDAGGDAVWAGGDGEADGVGRGWRFWGG